jgi:transcriptional regulator with XRE-family HTH domain
MLHSIPKTRQSQNVTVLHHVLAVQCKMARTALGLGVRELAQMADKSPTTIAKFERGEELRAKTVEDIQHALEAAGVEFIAENGGGPGVRLARPAKRKARR